MDKLVIVKITKAADNRTMFELSDGKSYDYSSVLQLVENGQMNNVVAEYRNGVKVLQYDPNSMQANDLYNVPENLLSIGRNCGAVSTHRCNEAGI